MIFDPEMWVPFIAERWPDLGENTLNRSNLAASSAWLPLLYDTAVFGLTLYRTYPSLKNRNPSYIMKRLLQDGLIYYRFSFDAFLEGQD